MSAIAEAIDPRSALQAPPPAATGDYIASLRDNAGFLLGSVDWVAEKLFGVSLIEQFVKPFTGDWAALEVASGGWLNMGASLKAGADNYIGGKDQLPAVWKGAASDRAGARLLDVAELYKSQAEGCATLSEQLKHIIEVAKATGELIASLLSMVNDFLMRLAVQLATPVLGWVTGAIDSAATAVRFMGWVQKMARAVHKLIEVAQLAMKVVMTVQRMFAVAVKGMTAVTRAAQTGAGTYMDDTSRVQFGAR